MAIDVKEIQKHKVKSSKAKKRIIWFGNIRNTKKPFYRHFVAVARENGWGIDTINNSHFNNDSRTMTRDEIMRCLQYYEYGVGVGICAHEMSALGLKVFIYSYNHCCNCAYSKEQGKYYIDRNLCSPEEAHIPVKRALEQAENMVVIDPIDVHDNIKNLKRILSENFTPPKNSVV